MAATKMLIVMLALATWLLAGAASCGNTNASTGSTNGGPTKGNAGNLRKETVVIKGHTFKLEVAATDKTREDGLMYRTEIAEDGGMLFAFPRPDLRAFWMGNCLVDMDIMFLDQSGRITAMHRMKKEPPRREDETDTQYRNRMPSYSSRLPAQFAIELQSGWLDKLELKVQDKIELDLPKLKKEAR